MAFEDVFSIDVSSGRITLGVDRHVLFDADALGHMRRELIDNLGRETARGILERVGYKSGRNDARQLKEKHRWLSKEEGLRACPRLHFLEGIVKVELDTLEPGEPFRPFHVKGNWIGSWEAEQHLKHYGAGELPVCWTLEGYATGYASEIVARKIVCVETRCVGRGDPVCSFELRTAEEWGRAATPIEEMLGAERFERCLRSISAMGCELEKVSFDAIITTDSAGTITSCSQGAHELFGLLPGEALGRKFSAFLSGGAGEARGLVQRLNDTGRIRNYLTEITTPAGRRTPIALSASAIRDNSGALVGTLSVAHDMREIRRLEDELGQKNRFMANILQDSADAIITLGPEDEITSWNKGAENIFGFSAAEAVGQLINIIIPPDLIEARELAEIREKLHTRGVVNSYQTERLTKDGRRINVIFTRTAIRDDKGHVVGSSVVLKDVTTFRSLEKQLGDAERLASLGELSAGLAHEIKNPLAGIKGAIEVIQESIPVSDMHRSVLGDVLHEVNRIDQIVRDLLNYAKPKPPSHSSVNLPDIIQRIVAMVRKSSKNEALQVSVTKPDEIPGFTGDPIQLEQVFMNLLLNAQNVMPAGGRVDIRMSHNRKENSIRVEVRDNGPGIPPENMRKLFQPFFTTRTDGTGLGLATCLKNVRYHGGTIDVKSRVGKGTSFTVTLPLLSRL